MRRNIQFAVLGLSLLSACSSIPVKTVPAEYRIDAAPIKVKKPSWIFRSKFYEVELGDYSVSNAKIRNLEKSDTFLSKQKESRTLRNLIFRGELNPETVTTETYLEESGYRYSFDIVFGAGNTLKSECILAQQAKLEKEKSHALLESKKDKNDKRTSQTERSTWLQSTTFCELNHKGKIWDINMDNVDGFKQVAFLQSDSGSYQLKPMYAEAFGDSQVTVNDVAEKDTFDEYFGMAIMKNTEHLATFSVENSRDAIWISPSLDDSEAQLMLGVSFTLMLTEWLDDRMD